MRAFITCAILTVATLTINAAPARAQTVDAADLVDSWYIRYLGRHVDPAGLSDQLRAIRHGTPLDVIEACILASPEYYIRNGNTPEGFVAALYRDVLGRRAGAHEFSRQVNHVLSEGRNAAALRVLAERNPTVVVASAPVYVTPAPVIVARPAPVVIVGPTYRPAPIYVAPRPAFSIRIGIR